MRPLPSIVAMAAGVVLSMAGALVGQPAVPVQTAAYAGDPASDVHVQGHPGTQPAATTRGFTAATSRNWGGYVVTGPSGGTFDIVSATWTQPAVTCPSANAWVVFWVGFDGWFDGTVEQGGSSARCINGVPQYNTWWEMFPTNAIQTVFSISPGDSISSTVVFSSSNSVYTITVNDNTTRASFQHSATCGSGLTCNRSSAEWIAEPPGSGGNNFFPLANYGTAQIRECGARDAAFHAGGINASTWTATTVQEQSGGITYATPGAVSSDGLRFPITWNHQ
jgi:hypothetical protein